MSNLTEGQLITSLQSTLPKEVLVELLKEYKGIKQQFFLSRYRPSELNAARFTECVLRILEHVDTGTNTAFGDKKFNSEKIINKIENNVGLADTVRYYIPKLCRVILDIRNKRDIAHVAGSSSEVSPNFSDSLFLVHSVDWILTEIVRHFYVCSMQEATNIVKAINTISIPIVEEIDGFIRVLDTNLNADKKVLVILYHKQPDQVSEKDLLIWTEYQNSTNFRKNVLTKLHKKALIHFNNGSCYITLKGKLFVDSNIEPSLIIS